MLAVEDVSQGLQGLLVARGGNADPSRRFSRVVIDSRQAQAGDLFVALPGQWQDGHDYVGDAVGHGALGAIVARPLNGLPPDVAVFQVSDTLLGLQRLAAYWRSRHDVRVVGVTGSVGKTTCKELIAVVLEQKRPVLKSEANLNTEIGLPLTLLKLTPEQPWAVLEMAMQGPEEIALLSSIAKPQVGVVTNIGPVHLERLGSIEAIAAAKGELVEALPPDGAAVLNSDDDRVAALATRSKAPVSLYGTSPKCQVSAAEVTGHGLEGLSFRLSHGETSVKVSTRLPGRHHVYPALAAAAVALTEGFALQEVADALAAARPSLRLRVLPGSNGSTILDDSYNASPASMLASLDLLSEMKGRRIALLGDMLELGAAEEEGHRQVGEQAALSCDVLFVVGERANIIAAAAMRAGLQEVRVCPSKEEAATALRKDLRPGDHLLVKASLGLGMETVVETLRAP